MTTEGARPLSDATKTRVFIVEDHRSMVDLLERWFEDEADIEVVGRATRGSDAVDEILSLRPDVALVDYRLPDGNGVDVARGILEQLPETAVVILTGMGAEKVLAEAVELGCAGFVDKSQPVDEILAAVRAAAAGDLHFSPEQLQAAARYLRAPDRGPGADLTTRELEVLRLLAQGRSTEAISEQLFVSVHTVRNHVRSVLAKLGAHSQLEAVAIAARAGIVDVGT